MSELLRKAFEKHKILKKRPWLGGKASQVPPHGMNDDAIASWRLAAQRATGAKPHPSYEPNGQMRLLTRGMQSMERFFSAFSNWKNPGIRQLLKEYKIEGKMKGNAFWNNKRDFVDAVKNAKVEKITPSQDAKISYRSRTANKEGLLNLIKGYRSYPKYRNEGTLNAIYDGFSKNAPMDRPLVVDFGDGKRRVFSGNTRMDAAYHSGIDPEVLVVRGKKKNLEAKLHEFKLVRPLKIEKFADAKTRAAVGKSLRRWLEKQPGMDRSAVRSALGARPLMRQITTKKEAARLNRQDFGKQWDSLDEAGKAALQARLGKTATKPGYVHSQAAPRIVLINNQPSLLSYRGIKKGGEDRQITRNLRRPFLGRSETLSQRASGNSPKVAEARANGGFAAHVEQPNGASLSTSTNKNTPVQEGFLAPDEKGESALGVYATPLKKIIQRTKDSKKIGMVNKKYPQEHEITQPNGGNLIAIRKYIQGVDGHHYPGNRREFSALREFKSYDKTGEEERRGFLKTGILGAGIAAAGGLAGLGLYKAGVSGASQKLARLTRAVRNASANKAEGVRAAKAAAARAGKQSNVFRDASIEAQAMRAQKMKAASRAKAPEETKIPENIINPKAPAKAKDTVPVVNTTKSNKVADQIAESNKVADQIEADAVGKNPSAPSAVPSAPPAAPPAAPKAPAAAAKTKKPQATPAKPAASATSEDFVEIPEVGKFPNTGTPEQKAAFREKINKAHASGGFKGRAAADVVDEIRQSLAYPDQKSDFPPGLSDQLRAAGRGNNPQPKARKKDKKSAEPVLEGLPPVKGLLPDLSNLKPEQRRALQAEARQRRKNRQKNLAAILRGMKAFNFQTDEGGIPFTGKVAKDRFIKKLRDEDLDRRDANILRAGAAGSLAGLLLKGKLSAGKRALIGAGLGGAGVVATRMATNNTRDIYGERSRGAKRAEFFPALAGLGAAGYFASRRLRGLSARLRGVKEFAWILVKTDRVSADHAAARRAIIEKYGKHYSEVKKDGPSILASRNNPDSPFYVPPEKREEQRLRAKEWHRANRLRRETNLSSRLCAVKFFEKKKEKKSVNPYLGAALSGGASGAVLGGLSVFKRNVSPLQALRTAGKFGAVSAGIVGGGALLGSRIIGKPREDESAPFTKRAGLGGAIAGAGVGLAGALALRKTKSGAKILEGASQNWRPAMWIRDSPLGAGAAVGTVGGALYGGAQGLDEGQQVDSIRNLKKDMKTVASEHGNQVWKSAARTSVHGFSRRGKIVFFGRDDQPRYRDTKAWADPITGWVTGANLVDKDGNAWKPSSPQLVNAMVNRAQRERIKVQRGYGLTKDTAAVLQGKARERDASGRIKKREWEKSWFKNAVTTAGLAAAGLVGAGVWRYGRMNPSTRIGGFVKKTEQGIRKTKDDFNNAAGRVMRGVDDMTGKKFSAKIKMREFDVIAKEAGWDVRDPRGRSARVFAPGSRRRERREKAWHEKTENERKLWKAGIVAGALAGGLGGVGIYRLAKGKSLVPSFVTNPKPAMQASKEKAQSMLAYLKSHTRPPSKPEKPIINPALYADQPETAKKAFWNKKQDAA